MEREGETQTETKRGEIRVTAAHRNRAEQFQTPCVAKMDKPSRLGKTPLCVSSSSWSVALPHAHISAPSLINSFSQSNDLDSITLGQLKAMVNSAPKPKARTSSSVHPELHVMIPPVSNSNVITTLNMMTKTPSSTR